MAKLAIIGAGTIGSSIAKLLSQTRNYSLRVIDVDSAALDRLGSNSLETHNLDIHDTKALQQAIEGVDIVVSACAYHENIAIAELCLKVGASYFDLTEDIDTARAVQMLSQLAGEGQVFMPQCGLAPGFINILAQHVASQFDELASLKLRVGALPEFPSNLMMYNLTWSTEGLINEYCNPCHAIKKSEPVELVPLEGLEKFSLDGMEYEAFNTSGGLGTLRDTLLGKVKDLTYKTIRYKGHQYLMDFLINGLKLGERRQLLKKIFENAVATTRQDVVIILVSGTGYVNGKLCQITDSRKIYNREVNGEHWGAIQVTTAAGLCAVIDLFRQKKTPQRGFIRQEQVDYRQFMNSRFGHYFRPV